MSIKGYNIKGNWPQCFHLLCLLARFGSSSKPQMVYRCKRQVGARAPQKRQTMLTIQSSCHTDIKYSTVPSTEHQQRQWHCHGGPRKHIKRKTQKGEKIDRLLCSLDCVLVSDQTSLVQLWSSGGVMYMCPIPSTKTCVKGKRQNRQNFLTCYSSTQ